MTRILFTCDVGSLPKGLARQKWDKKAQVNHQGKSPNLDLKIENITSAILRNLDPKSADLIRIASYIYAADQAISRGSEQDIYGSQWTREMEFVIPVSNPSFWEQSGLKTQLADTLLFLMGDVCNFSFVKGATPNGQLFLDLPVAQPHDNADSVMLLSGGADSACAVVESVAKYGKRPILVSHRSVAMTHTRQALIADQFRRRFPHWVFPHISIWAHLKGAEAKEYTQRSRSFLFCALAAAVAYQTNINDVLIADNGVVSINMPKTAQLVGTYASRSTHPKFLHYAQELFQSVYERGITISNPLQFMTRAETLAILKENGCSEILQETVSCARTRQPGVTPHCGVCSQCVDRRFGSLAAGIEDHDLVERYGVDVFFDEIPEGPDRTLVESYVRFAQDIEQLTDEAIFSKYVELFDCIIPGDPDPSDTATQWVSLLRRHAQQVSRVIQGLIKDNVPLLFNASLPNSSLVRLVASGRHLEDPRQQFAVRVSERLRIGIPKTFQSHSPKNEHEVQDAADAILSGAKEELDREIPLLPFAGISTKPDLAKQVEYRGWFFVEMKYPKNRTRLNATITEITSRVSIYQKQGAFVLFAIYDPHRCISGDREFADEFAKDDNVIVSIIR